MDISGNSKVYWTMKNNKQIDVDLMDVNHIKNAFKHLIKHHQNIIQQANEVVDKYNALVRKRKAERGSASFNLNGDIAEFFNEEQNNSFQNDYYESALEVGITDIETGIL